MPPFNLREPVSALTHALGLAAALPTTWLLIRAAMKRPTTDPAARGFQNAKIASLAAFGIGMAACYAGSVAYHAIPGDERTVDLLRRLDMLGIFLLIAGTFTPVAWVLMRPWPRRGVMVVAWGVSSVCGAAMAVGLPFPTWLATSIYLALGWGGALCYLEMRRNHDRRTLRFLPIGGALYSLGAVVNLTHAEFATGLAAHEVFHLFVLAGTAAHVAFLFQVAVPAPAPASRVNVLRPGLPRERRRRQVRIDA